MNPRPECYPDPPAPALTSLSPDRLPLLDVLTSPVPSGLFQSPVDWRHVLCIHLGNPVSVAYGPSHREQPGVRIHGQFCVVPAGTSTRWIVSQPTQSLLLRIAPSLLLEAADAMGIGSQSAELAPSIHIRDPQVERIGWMMQAEDNDSYPGGRLFADSLASALASRLLSLQGRRSTPHSKPTRALPAWRLRNVIEYIEAHLDKDLTLAELAAVAGFSLSHFKSLFKQSVGLSVHRFVLERRVERARLRLLEGEASLTGVALEAGFAHPSHMARCMRRLLGISPSDITRNRRLRYRSDLGQPE
jgi:AraC family transcriptional regulator